MPNNPQLEAISLKMYKIENRRPYDFKDSFVWRRLNREREKMSIECIRQELEYHKDRLMRLGGERARDSITKIGQYERYLEKYDTKSKGVENEIQQG